MKFFGGKDRDPDDSLLNESIDRAKRNGRWLLNVDRAHNEIGCQPGEDGAGATSGPSCDTASSPKKGRRW
ncbi:hypothetical protein JBE04_20805 [Streptomyces sp. PRKS01-29]|nr:hypothetical protein [Streptomyces sabulosicollis]MBI0296833.1 hypothetical protein [Streptomyces sabulosicollis]